MTRHTSILIIGAGPAGLMLACLLKKQGVPFCIVDKKSTRSEHIKACLLTSRSLDIFSILGLSEKLISIGQPIYGFEIFCDKKTRVYLDFLAIPARFAFNLHIGQPLIEKILYESLLSENQMVLWNHDCIALTQDDHGVTATLMHDNKKIDIRADFVIGADGVSSHVREYGQFLQVGDTYPTHYLLGSVSLDWSLSHDVARLFFSDMGFLSAYPLHGNMMQVGGNIVKPTQKEPNLVELEQLFQSRSFFSGKIQSVKDIAYYRSHYRFVKNTVKNRVILIGDAAHVISALTGFGMNAGLHDAENLAEKLYFIYQEKNHATILMRYQDERRIAVQKLMSFSNVLESVYAPCDDQSKRMRDYLISNLISSEVSRQKEARRLMQR